MHMLLHLQMQSYCRHTRAGFYLHSHKKKKRKKPPVRRSNRSARN